MKFWTSILFVTSALFLSNTAMSAGRLSALFKNKKPIIAVINVPALPGQKGFVSMEKAIQDALTELKVLEDNQVDGAIVENNDGGFEATPEIMAAMTLIVSEVVKASKNVVIGCEILWHDPKASLALAQTTGAKFIRTDFWIDEMKADDRIINENPDDIIAYQKSIGAENIVIMTDIQVKYAEMINPNKTITESAQQAKSKYSDGVVVTGRKSGVPPDVARVKEAKDAVGDLEIVLGSGTTYLNAPELLGVADAAIVGTSISTKTGGVLVDEKVKQFMEVVRSIREQSK